jgi:ribose transport system substrate-binding protein
VPHPNATYFGVDNFEVGYEAGSLLAQHALRKWKGKVDWVSASDSLRPAALSRAASPAHSTDSRTLADLPADRFIQIEGRGMRQPSRNRR